MTAVPRWISKATRAQARASARAPTPTHMSVRARTHPSAHPHTPTHTRTQKYVIFIAFPQQWLRERASVLRYRYTAPLVF
jgi:hypothetical protein